MRETGSRRLGTRLFLGAVLVFVLAPLAVTLAPLVDPDGGAAALVAHLADERVPQALFGSLVVVLGVTAVALPLGLAGALALHRLAGRGAGVLFAVLVAPAVVPGVVAGLATMILWRGLGVDDGLLLAGLARTGTAAALAMLVFLVRLARLDPALVDAARDLGAAPGLVMRRLVLPHLAPAVPIAAGLAALVTLHDVDAAALAAGDVPTLATAIAALARNGPSATLDALAAANAIAVVAAAVLWAARRRRSRRTST